MNRASFWIVVMMILALESSSCFFRMLVDVFDVTGRQTGHWTYNDDGTFIG